MLYNIDNVERIKKHKKCQKRLNLNRTWYQSSVNHGVLEAHRTCTKRIMNSKVSLDEEKQCNTCKKTNHSEENCYLRCGYEAQLFFKQFRPRKGCFVCRKSGHLEKDCRSKKLIRDHQKQEEEEVALFNAAHIGEQVSGEEVWLIDSGATNHMTKEERFFITLDTSVQIPIRIGNGARIMTTGKGNIEVMTRKGARVIRDVFLVPEIDKNLLSVPQMVRNGNQVLFVGNKCIIHNRNGEKIAEVEMVRKAYLLRMQLAEESV